MVSSSFAGLAKGQARILGIPDLPIVVLPHPIGGTPLPSVLEKVDAALPNLFQGLTTPIGTIGTGQNSHSVPSEWIDVDGTDEWGALQSEFISRNWGDGLIICPPTRERVEAMVRFSGMEPDHVVATVAPKMGAATVERIAANAVMAGCRPHHMPLLIASLQALADQRFNLKSVQATTHCIAPLLIVSGPLTECLRINNGSGLFGPGPWSNGVVGRAIRLMLLNLGGGYPGEVDKATMGHPGKFTFCIGEKEVDIPWPSLKLERGHAEGESVVTAFGGEAPHNINDHESTTAGGLLTSITGSIAQIGQNGAYYASELLLVLSPEHAATIAADGFTKEDIRRSIYDDARVPASRFSKENRERRLWRFHPKRFKDRPLDVMVPLVHRPEDVVVIVAGGPGKHSMYVPSSGITRSVTKVVAKSDGTPWLPAHFAS